MSGTMTSRTLDFAARQNWWPFTAGFLTVPGATLAIFAGIPWFWLPAALGLIMTAVCPVGTSLLRYRRLIREKQRLDRELAAATATLTVLGQLDRLVSRLQGRVRGHAGNEDDHG